MKFCVILGTRPEIIKLCPIIRELEKRKLDYFVIHTNQHYSEDMDRIFFQELNLNPAKYNLNVGSESHGKQTGLMLERIEPILLNEKPDFVLVQGDTNTVLAGALVASKLGIKIGHVEAGLRSYNRTMPEEINRIVTDHVSDYLFAPTKEQKEILKKENLLEKTYVVGNSVVDAVYQNIPIAEKKFKISDFGLNQKKYVLLTMHRPANVDDHKRLLKIISNLDELSKEYDFIYYFPIHPRTKKMLNAFNINLSSRFKVVDPVGYLEMLYLMKNSILIITDSGGILEEACVLRIPTLNLRNETERPEANKVGASKIVGDDYQKLISAFKHYKTIKFNWKNPFGDGKTSQKIIDILTKM